MKKKPTDKTFRHNDEVDSKGEPSWSVVDKRRLPQEAFCGCGDGTKTDACLFPHHWVKEGAKLDDGARFTEGELLLHERGLTAAWAAATGIRSGVRASDDVVAHLSAHRKALGLSSGEGKSGEVSAEARDPGAIDKNVRRVIVCDDPDLVAKDGHVGRNGVIEGHAAVWDKIDLQSEIIRRGTFLKSIDETVKNGKVKLLLKHFLHGGDVGDLIGTVKRAHEDDFGLAFHAPLSSVQRAQETRTLIKEGHVNGSSVGFLPLRWGFIDVNGKKVVEHIEGKLIEVTITARPAQPTATVVAKVAEGVTVAEFVDEFSMTLDAVLSSWSPDGGRPQDEGVRSQAKRLVEDLSSLQAKVSGLLRDKSQAPVAETAKRRLHRIWTEIEKHKLSLDKFNLS